MEPTKLARMGDDLPLMLGEKVESRPEPTRAEQQEAINEAFEEACWDGFAFTKLNFNCYSPAQ